MTVGGRGSHNCTIKSGIYPSSTSPSVPWVGQGSISGLRNSDVSCWRDVGGGAAESARTKWIEENSGVLWEEGVRRLALPHLGQPTVLAITERLSCRSFIRHEQPNKCETDYSKFLDGFYRRRKRSQNLISKSLSSRHPLWPTLQQALYNSRL